MIQIGINGFGRIGKICFLQLIAANAPVTAINVPDFDINNLETYLRCDSNHHYPMNWTIDIIDKDTFTIDGKTIKLLNSRAAKNLNWRKYGVNYVIDATGVFLTQEAAEEHNVDYLIMCAPAKDNTPSFMVGGNHELYNGERIVSNVSCTSNAIIPCLKALNDGFGIEDANFITVHSTTASQACVDTVKFKNRTSRSLFNNIIPHTTGASKAIYAILPELKGKVFGTSVRVPTSNVSMIDLNVKVKADCDLSTVLKHCGTYFNFNLFLSAHFLTCLFTVLLLCVIGLFHLCIFPQLS
jgi:glyceraldehyde 3-phosphate dehydrogenase